MRFREFRTAPGCAREFGSPGPRHQAPRATSPGRGGRGSRRARNRGRDREGGIYLGCPSSFDSTAATVNYPSSKSGGRRNRTGSTSKQSRTETLCSSRLERANAAPFKLIESRISILRTVILARNPLQETLSVGALEFAGPLERFRFYGHSAKFLQLKSSRLVSAPHFGKGAGGGGLPRKR